MNLYIFSISSWYDSSIGLNWSIASSSNALVISFGSKKSSFQFSRLIAPLLRAFSTFSLIFCDMLFITDRVFLIACFFVIVLEFVVF